MFITKQAMRDPGAVYRRILVSVISALAAAG